MYESVEYLIKALDTKVPGMKQGFNERDQRLTYHDDHFLM